MRTRCIALLLTIAIAGVFDGRAAQSEDVQQESDCVIRNADRTELQLAVLSGFVDACSRDTHLYKVNAQLPPTRKFLGCFLTQDDWDMFVGGGGRLLSPQLAADAFSVEHYGISEPTDFSDLAEQVRSVAVPIEAECTESDHEAVDSTAEIISDFLSREVTAEIDSVTPLGVFADEPSRISYMTLTFVRGTVDGKALNFQELSTVTFLYVNKRILRLDVRMQYSGEDDREVIEELTERWVSATWSCNDE